MIIYLPELLIRVFTVLIAVASIAPFLFPVLRPELRRFLDIASFPLRAINVALRFPLGLPLRRRLWRYPIMLIAFAATCAAALRAPAPYWAFAGLLSLSIPIAVVTAWNQNELQRQNIVWNAAFGSPDQLPDYRDQAIVASMLLLPAFGAVLFRLSPFLHAFTGADGATFWTWLQFALDQFFHALLFDLLDILDWHGFSGIVIRSGVAPDAIILERLITAFIRSVYTLTLINGVVRMAQIAQTLRDGVRLLPTDAALVLRLGDRAERDLKAYLSEPESLDGAVAAGSPALRKMLLDAVKDGEPPASTKALSAVSRLGMLDALPAVVRRLDRYAARCCQSNAYSSPFGRGEGRGVLGHAARARHSARAAARRAL